jgi:hypothetical protein
MLEKSQIRARLAAETWRSGRGGWGVVTRRLLRKHCDARFDDEGHIQTSIQNSEVDGATRRFSLKRTRNHAVIAGDSRSDAPIMPYRHGRVPS